MRNIKRQNYKGSAVRAGKTNRSKNGKNKQKMSAAQMAQFYDMMEIEWFPVDPYCD